MASTSNMSGSGSDESGNGNNPGSSRQLRKRNTATTARPSVVLKKCRFCSKMLAHVEEHEQNHLRPRDHKCRLCTNAYMKPGQLKRHLQREHKLQAEAQCGRNCTSRDEIIQLKAQVAELEQKNFGLTQNLSKLKEAQKQLPQPKETQTQVPGEQPIDSCRDCYPQFLGFMQKIKYTKNSLIYEQGEHRRQIKRLQAKHEKKTVELKAKIDTLEAMLNLKNKGMAAVTEIVKEKITEVARYRAKYGKLV